MTYILNIEGYYYFSRKVPLFLKAYDPRAKVRFALHTDSKKEAQKLAIVHNETLEDYWRALVRDNRQYCPDGFKSLVLQSRRAGFAALGDEPGAHRSTPIAKTSSPTI